MNLARLRLWSTVLLATLASCAAACTHRGYRAVDVPSAGVTFTYAFDTGARFDGKLHVGNMQQVEGLGPQSRNIEFAAALVVLGPDSTRNGTILSAELRDVQLEWDLPPGATLARDEFRRAALKTLDGLQIKFVVDRVGHVLQMPRPPAHLPQPLQDLIVAASAGLERSFVVLPNKPLHPGDHWIPSPVAEDDGPELSMTFEGLFRPKDGTDALARLIIEHAETRVVDDDEGRHVTDVHGETRVWFSTAGHVALVESDERTIDGREGVTLTRIRAEWTGGLAAGAAAVEAAGVTDPCNPDYAGSRLCETT